MTLEDKGYFASFVPCDDEVSRLCEEAQLTKQSSVFANSIPYNDGVGGNLVFSLRLLLDCFHWPFLVITRCLSEQG